ncbi:MAG: sulfotransferase domain-containing protein [Leptolyngbyaceae bacterium]|nr:sulfotransferase domain-containing protein [Leptolyngbyaceae bacterium]
MDISVPHFICIGAQRSGTTWLYETLIRHPDVFLPPIKELHYFDSLDQTVPVGYRFHERRYRLKKKRNTCLRSLLDVAQGRVSNPRLVISFWKNYFLGDGSFSWYQHLFSQAAKGGKITGEITPAYSLLSTEYIQKLKQLNSDLKIIYVLRNPIDRSFSQATKDLIRSKNLKASDVSDEDFINFFKSDICARRSNYHDSLVNFRNIFSEDKLLICFFDEIQDNPKALIGRICEFIDVEPLSETSIVKGQVNSSTHLVDRMPEKVASFLVETYLPSIEQLMNDVGGYAKEWYREIMTYRSEA